MAFVMPCVNVCLLKYSWPFSVSFERFVSCVTSRLMGWSHCHIISNGRYWQMEMPAIYYIYSIFSDHLLLRVANTVCSVLILKKNSGT